MQEKKEGLKVKIEKIGKSVNLGCELKNQKTCCPQTKKIAISETLAENFGNFINFLIFEKS